MALSALKTWVAEVLNSADLNAEIANILNNGEDLAWPATKDKDLDRFALIMDQNGDSQIAVTTDDVFEMQLQNVVVFTVDGDVANVLNGIKITASQTNTAVLLTTTGETNVDLLIDPKGTGSVSIDGSALINLTATSVQVNSAVIGAYDQIVLGAQLFGGG